MRGSEELGTTRERERVIVSEELGTMRGRV